VSPHLSPFQADAILNRLLAEQPDPIFYLEEIRAAGLDSGEIVAKVAEEVGVSPGLVGFILGQ